VNNAPYLSLLIATPLLGAFLTALFAKRLQGRHAKQVGLGISLLTLVLFIYVALQYELNSPSQFQLVEKYSWIPSFGVNYALGVDGLGLLMLAMTIVLVPVVLLAGWNDIAEEDTSRYVSLVLALEAVVIGVFTATDLFLFYVFFEAMLIPMYFLIGRFGGPERRRAAIKFLVFSLIGGLVLLVALISLWVTSIKLTGVGSFDLEFLSTLGIDPGIHCSESTTCASALLVARCSCPGYSRLSSSIDWYFGQSRNIRNASFLNSNNARCIC